MSKGGIPGGVRAAPLGRLVAVCGVERGARSGYDAWMRFRLVAVALMVAGGGSAVALPECLPDCVGADLTGAAMIFVILGCRS